MEAQGQLQLGGNPFFMRIKRMVGDEVTLYFTALLDLFGFLPFFEFLYGKNKIPQILDPHVGGPCCGVMFWIYQ